MSWYSTICWFYLRIKSYRKTLRTNNLYLELRLSILLLIDFILKKKTNHILKKVYFSVNLVKLWPHCAPILVPLKGHVKYFMVNYYKRFKNTATFIVRPVEYLTRPSTNCFKSLSLISLSLTLIEQRCCVRSLSSVIFN